jgi:hypothetical protein
MPTPRKRDAYRADLMREMNGAGRTSATGARRASASSTPRVSSPPAPSFDAQAIAEAAERKLAQKRALETVNAARVRGLTDTTRSAREIKRASFEKARPQARGGADRVWVEGFTRKDGTRVKGHWRTNPNPAEVDDALPFPKVTDPKAAEAGIENMPLTGMFSPVGLALMGAATIKSVHDAYKAMKGAFDITLGRAPATYQLDKDGKLVSRIPTEIQAGGMAAAGLAATGSVAGMGRVGVRNAVGSGPTRLASGVAPDINELGLYSQALRAARALPQEKGTPQQMLEMLKRAGVKDDEIKWTGLDKFLQQSGKQVTKKDIVEFIDANRVRLRERTYGGGYNAEELFVDLGENLRRLGSGWYAQTLNHGDWIVRPLGGNRYKARSDRGIQLEIDLTGNPTVERVAAKIADALEKSGGGEPARYAKYSFDPDNPTYREQVLQWLHPEGMSVQRTLPGGHFSVSGTVAHVRSLVDELREPPAGTNLKSGDRILHIEEIQSDAAQEARKIGIKPTGEEGEKLRGELKRVGKELSRVTDQTAELHAEMVRFTSKHGVSGGDVTDLIGIDVDPAVRDQAWALLERNNQLIQQYNRLSQEFHALQQLTQGVEPMPYIDSTNKWVDLALKTQLVRAARDPSVKGISLIAGKDVAQRFSQIRVFDYVEYQPIGDKFEVRTRDVYGNRRKDIVSSEQLPDVVGSEIAERILRGEGEKHGMIHELLPPFAPMITRKGQGNIAFYNKIVPQRLKEIVRKIDPQAKIGEGKLSVQSTDQSPVKVLEMTEKMREKIIRDGLSLFVNRPGAGVPALPLMTPREQREAEHRAALRESVRRRSRQRREFYRALARGDAT